MTRRELIGFAALYLGAAALGVLGGVTSTEEGRKPERKDSRGQDKPQEAAGRSRS